MTIAIGKKSKGQNDILIVTKNTLPDHIQIFVKQALELQKDAPFRIGSLPIVQGKDIFYTIIIHLKDLKIFNANMEDIVADLGAHIKKIDKDFFLNLDDSGLNKEDAKLFAELLMTNLYSFSKYKKANQTHYSLTIQCKYINAKHFAQLTEVFTIMKDLINDPSHSINPTTFEQEARQMFAKEKNVKITVFDDKELLKR